NSREEFIDSYVRPPDQGTQSPAGDVFVVRNRERRDVARFGQDDVAPSLSRNLPPEMSKRPNDFGRLQERDRRHVLPTRVRRPVPPRWLMAAHAHDAPLGIPESRAVCSLRLPYGCVPG